MTLPPQGIIVRTHLADGNRLKEHTLELRIVARCDLRRRSRVGDGVQSGPFYAAVAQEDAPTPDEQVAGDEVHIHPFLQAGQIGIAARIRGLARLRHKALNGFEPAFGAPAAETDSRVAIHEEIAVHEIVLAAVDLDTAESDAAAPLEDIPCYRDTGDHVVQANARRPTHRAAPNVGPAVPADDDAAIQGIAEHVEPALIVRFPDDVADHVQLDQVVVAFDPQRGRRHILKEIVGDAIAAAVEMDGRGVGPLKPRDVGHGAVLDKVPAGRQGPAVAARDARPAAAERVHRAGEDAVMLSSLDHDGVAAQSLQRTMRDQAVGPAADVNAVAPPFLKRQPDQQHVLDPIEGHEGLIEYAQDRLGLRRLDPFRRQPVDLAGAAVEIPFARAVDLAEDVHRIVTLVFAVAILRIGPGQGEGPGVRVDGRHLLILLVPIPEPIAVETDVRLIQPAARPVFDVPELPIPAPLDRIPDFESVLAEDLARLDKALVGPAGERLGPAVHEQLGPPAQGRRIAPVRHAQRLEIGLQHPSANRRIELVAQGRVRDRLPSGNSHPAAQDGRPAGLGLVDDRGLGRP